MTFHFCGNVVTSCDHNISLFVESRDPNNIGSFIFVHSLGKKKMFHNNFDLDDRSKIVVVSL